MEVKDLFDLEICTRKPHPKCAHYGRSLLQDTAFMISLLP